MADGQLTGVKGFIPPSNSVGDDAANANSPFGVTKTRHLHKEGTEFGLAIGGTPVTAERTIFIATSSGSVRHFRAALKETGSSTGITFDLKKYPVGTSSGSSVLSATADFTNSDADNTPKAGTISSAPFVAGDRFTALMTVSSATGAAGPFAWAEFDELAG